MSCGAEKPEMPREENFISVMNNDNDELFKIPVASSRSHHEEIRSRNYHTPPSDLFTREIDTFRSEDRTLRSRP
jgi:hypothetical protein